MLLVSCMKDVAQSQLSFHGIKICTFLRKKKSRGKKKNVIIKLGSFLNILYYLIMMTLREWIYLKSHTLLFIVWSGCIQNCETVNIKPDLKCAIKYFFYVLIICNVMSYSLFLAFLICICFFERFCYFLTIYFRYYILKFWRVNHIKLLLFSTF